MRWLSLPENRPGMAHSAIARACVEKALAVFTCAVLTLSLAACSPKEESKNAQPKTASIPGKPVGKLTIGLSSLGSAERYLPWLEAGREGWLVLEPIYESLIMADPRTGAFVPQLAEKYEVSPDGKTWRFTLRKRDEPA